MNQNSGESEIELRSLKLKNDRFRRVRGGHAFFLILSCARCGARLMVYQKDGDGGLLRCYLNRIFSPPHLERLQHDASIREPSDLLPLTCSGCKAVVGHPTRHHDGRLAFRLVEGSVRKTKLRRTA